jgi:hypothetical protein
VDLLLAQYTTDSACFIGGEEKAFDNLMATLTAYSSVNQELPALYLSYHVPNFQHPAATCQRIARDIFNLFEHVTAVEVRLFLRP